MSQLHQEKSHIKLCKMYLSWILVLVWICFIWSNSLASGQGSDATSLYWVSRLQSVLRCLGIYGQAVQNHFIRKAAHFLEYFVLGLLVSNARFYSWEDVYFWNTKYSSKIEMLTGLLIFIIPAIDETIQLYVPGRSGQLTDVILDISGAVIGCIFASHYFNRK